MNKKTLVIILCFFSLSSSLSAKVVQGIDIDFVTISNPGNPGDPRAAANPTGCGAVDYIYQIGKYEVTNDQWEAFVAAAGAPTGNNSNAYDESTPWTGTYVPTTKVSWYEAAQFCNYLTSGDKSQGAYQFSGNNTNPGDFLVINRDSAVSTYGIAYVIPTEDEWYKAAFYTGSSYSTYANGQDTIPVADNGWNYSGGAYSSPWDVGSGTMEQNGTFDMMGNVWEWNENLLYGTGTQYCFNGGSYNTAAEYLSSSDRSGYYSSYEGYGIGLRVASVPEPTTVLLFSIGVVLLRKRK